MRFLLNCLFAGAVFAVLSAPAKQAWADDRYSIIAEEPQAKVPLPKPVRRARGSSSPSPVPPYQSTVTRPGVAPRAVEPYPIDRSGSPAGIAAGVSNPFGTPAVTPARPAGQGFQDRALNCVHAGSAQGLSPGQIGTYTGGCVNQ